MKTFTISTGKAILIGAILVVIGFSLGLLSVRPGLERISQGTLQMVQVESRRAVDRTNFKNDYPEFYEKSAKSDPQAFQALLLGKDPKRDRMEFFSGGNEVVIGIISVREPWLAIYPGLPGAEELSTMFQHLEQFPVEEPY